MSGPCINCGRPTVRTVVDDVITYQRDQWGLPIMTQNAPRWSFMCERCDRRPYIYREITGGQDMSDHEHGRMTR